MDIERIAEAVVAQVLGLLILTMPRYFIRWWIRPRYKHPQWHLRSGGSWLLIALWIFVISTYFYFRFPMASVFSLATAFLVMCFLLFDSHQFRRLGIVGADKAIGAGLNYDQSLRLCTAHFDFLGTGAAKLTESQEFQAAVARCQTEDRPIRLLLTTPENEVLENAAKQAGANPDEYRSRIRKSLKEIRRLVRVKKFNIDVRFYDKARPQHTNLPEPFRLLFVNDKLCLSSVNIWGRGDGSQLPQLHILSSDAPSAAESFYHIFKLYFNRLWDTSEPWDFSEYINGY